MASDPEPFAELLRLARGGDPAARGRLFDRLAGAGADADLLLKMARGVLPRGDRMRAFVESRDLLQSALKSGWLDLSNFKGESKTEFLGWLRAILRRKLGRVVRRRTPRPTGELAEDGKLPAPAEPPLSALIREEVKARVRAAVGTLPEHERVVMEMRLQGLNATEIAGITGLDPATIRKRESRAADRLRAVLKGDSA